MSQDHRSPVLKAPETTCRLVLVRHGAVPGIAPPTFRGTQELALTEAGQQQARLTGRYLASLDDVKTVLSSPLGRCSDTASCLAKPHGLSPILLPGLTDMDYGAWQGRSHDEVQSADPEAYDAWMTTPDIAVIPDGETLDAVALRVMTALSPIVASAEGTIIVVTHDSTIRTVILSILELPLRRYWHFRSDPCGISTFEAKGTGWLVQHINECGHLHPMGAST